MGEDAFNPRRALDALTDSGVRFILIGGLAANVHGAPILTSDIDICYARDGENLRRLAEALVEVRARLRGAPPDVPFQLDARTLEAGGNFTFETDVGDVDIVATPAGTSGFDGLDANAEEFELEGVLVRVAALDDIIRMKRAAGRSKDMWALEILEALREEIDRP